MYITFVFQIFGMFDLIQFGRITGRFGLSSNLISQKVHKMHQVDLVCGVNVWFCRDLSNHKRFYVTGTDNLRHLCIWHALFM